MLKRYSAFRRCLHNPRRATIISTIRGKRPHYTKVSTEPETYSVCPFCPGNEAYTPPATLVLKTLGEGKYGFLSEKSSGEVREWIVRVFPNKYPALTTKDSSDLTYGYHEVLVETRIHSEEEYLRNAENVYLAFKTLKERVKRILQDSKIKHVMVIKNKGAKAGASIIHPHLQIFANTFTPPEIEEEIHGFRKYFKEKGKCPLCYLLSIKEDLVFYTNEEFASLIAYAPRVPYETHIIPLRHDPSFLSLSDNELFSLSEALSKTLLALRKVLGDFDYNFWFHTIYDSSLSFYHWHIEILPLTTTWGGYEKGSGVYIVDKFPEVAASELRKVISEGM